MMLTPAAPRAGPTGGDGFAAPPLTCSFTTLLTSLAIITLTLISDFRISGSYTVIFICNTFKLFQLAYRKALVEFFFQKSLP